MIHAIGTPGQPPRLYVESLTPDPAIDQVRAGEVCVETAEKIRPGVIAADGKSVEKVPGA